MQDQPNATPAPAPDIEDQVSELFTAMEGLPDDVSNEALNAALLAQAGLIRSIAQACENTKLFERSKAKVDEFAIELTAKLEQDRHLVTAWLWFLDRVANAPTYLHIISSVRLCMPLVAHYLPAPVPTVTKITCGFGPGLREYFLLNGYVIDCQCGPSEWRGAQVLGVINARGHHKVVHGLLGDRYEHPPVDCTLKPGSLVNVLWRDRETTAMSEVRWVQELDAAQSAEAIENGRKWAAKQGVNPETFGL